MSNQIVEATTTVHHCAVCGDIARYLFYGTRSCDSCRTFFRRQTVVTSSRARRCRFDNKCDVNVKSRKFCPACRLAKCRRVGMMGELVSVDEDSSNLTNMSFDKFDIPKSVFNYNNQDLRDEGWTSNLFNELMALKKKLTDVPRPMSTCDFTIYIGSKAITLRSLSSYEINKIEELACAGNVYKKLLPDANDHVESHRDDSTCAFLNTINTGTQKIIASIQAFTVFRNLDPGDREIMARDGIVEVLIAWSMFALNNSMTQWAMPCFQGGAIRVPEVLSTEVLKRANDGDQLFNNYMRLARTFDASWRRDPFLCSLFGVISIFGDRCGLREGAKVAFERSVFFGLMNRYVEAMYGPRQEVEAMMAMSTIYKCFAQVVLLRQQFKDIRMDIYEGPLAIIG